MIAIDFQGGAHGNFLEIVCNEIAGVTISKISPFSASGAAHRKIYTRKKYFACEHYSFTPIEFPPDTSAVVSIKIQEIDLLPLLQISFLRAGDYYLDNDVLEIDTYNKLNNPQYSWVLKELIDGFFAGQITKSYNAVKDPTWPTISNLKDFLNLPEHIQLECVNQHKLELLELSDELPHCPRHVLREYFQIGFEHPSQHGFIKRQAGVRYPTHWPKFEFPFDNFYNKEKFIIGLKELASWANISYNNWDKVLELHAEFLKRQPYKDSKIICDQVVEDICNGKDPNAKLTMIEEAYVNSQLKIRGHECRY